MSVGIFRNGPEWGEGCPEDDLAGEPGGIGIGTALQQVDGNQPDYLPEQGADGILKAGGVDEGGGSRGKERSESFDRRETPDPVFGGLDEPHDGCDGTGLVAVAGDLAAPGGSPDADRTVRKPENGAVVVEHGGAGDVFAPQSAVGALAGPGFAEEEDSAASVTDCRGVDGHGVPMECRKVEEGPDPEPEEGGVVCGCKVAAGEGTLFRDPESGRE